MKEPPIVFPALHELREHLQSDAVGRELLQRLEMEIPIKENRRGIPSLWYIPLVGGERRDLRQAGQHALPHLHAPVGGVGRAAQNRRLDLGPRQETQRALHDERQPVCLRRGASAGQRPSVEKLRSTAGSMLTDPRSTWTRRLPSTAVRTSAIRATS